MLAIEGIIRLQPCETPNAYHAHARRSTDRLVGRLGRHSTIRVPPARRDATPCHDRHSTRHRRNSSCPSWSRRSAALGASALPRPPDLPVDPQARRHRFRADDRPRPRAARAARRASSRSARPRSSARERSADGTTKFLLRLADGKQIESVFIPDTPAQTFCISTQVGCAMTCAFCLTGKMGIDPQPDRRRDRRPGARARARARHARRPLQHRPDGHGRAAAQLRRDDEGAADPGRRARAARCQPRRVTLSTVGVLPALERLATEPLMPNLAISLHATTEEQRDLLVPINRKYGLEGAARRLPPLPAASGASGSRSST